MKNMFKMALGAAICCLMLGQDAFAAGPHQKVKEFFLKKPDGTYLKVDGTTVSSVADKSMASKFQYLSWKGLARYLVIFRAVTADSERSAVSRYTADSAVRYVLTGSFSLIQVPLKSDGRIDFDSIDFAHIWKKRNSTLTQVPVKSGKSDFNSIDSAHKWTESDSTVTCGSTTLTLEACS